MLLLGECTYEALTSVQFAFFENFAAAGDANELCSPCSFANLLVRNNSVLQKCFDSRSNLGKSALRRRAVQNISEKN
jgi:hypothetical protein